MVSFDTLLQDLRRTVAEIEQSEIALYSNFEGQVLGWTHYADMYREECVEPVAVTPPTDLPSAGPAQVVVPVWASSASCKAVKSLRPTNCVP